MGGVDLFQSCGWQVCLFFSCCKLHLVWQSRPDFRTLTVFSDSKTLAMLLNSRITLEADTLANATLFKLLNSPIYILLFIILVKIRSNNYLHFQVRSSLLLLVYFIAFDLVLCLPLGMFANN
ncbi:unnamed protein product [Brassica oleracea]